MAGGYTVPADGDFGVLAQRLTRHDMRISELERPTGSQTAEALIALQEQTDLLANFRTYSDTSGSANQVGAGTLAYTSPPEVSFTVDRPMRVLIQINAPFFYSYTAGVLGQVFVTYSLVGPSATGTAQAFYSLNSSAGVSGSATAVGVSSGTVGAGTHTLSVDTAQVFLSAGAGASDGITGDPITIIASVLGTV